MPVDNVEQSVEPLVGAFLGFRELSEPLVEPRDRFT